MAGLGAGAADALRRVLVPDAGAAAGLGWRASSAPCRSMPALIADAHQSPRRPLADPDAAAEMSAPWALGTAVALAAAAGWLDHAGGRSARSARSSTSGSEYARPEAARRSSNDSSCAVFVLAIAVPLVATVATDEPRGRVRGESRAGAAAGVAARPGLAGGVAGRLHEVLRGSLRLPRRSWCAGRRASACRVLRIVDHARRHPRQGRLVVLRHATARQRTTRAAARSPRSSSRRGATRCSTRRTG